MAIRYKILTLIIVGVFLLTGAVSCSQSGVSQDVYNTLKQQLSSTESQLHDLQTKMAELQKAAPVSGADTSNLTAQFNELLAQNNVNLSDLNALKDKYSSLTTQFNDLKTQAATDLQKLSDLQKLYDDLQAKYADTQKTAAPLVMSDVEQAIFNQMNQVRASAGLGQLTLGNHLYDLAKTNSNQMVTETALVLSSSASWQVEYRATGYTTAQQVADAAMAIWQSNVDDFKTNMLQAGAKYGAVAAVQSNGIIYITFLASIFNG